MLAYPLSVGDQSTASDQIALVSVDSGGDRYRPTGIGFTAPGELARSLLGLPEIEDVNAVAVS